MNGAWLCARACGRVIHIAPRLLAAYLSAHPIPTSCELRCSSYYIPQAQFLPGGEIYALEHGRPVYGPPASTGQGFLDENGMGAEDVRAGHGWSEFGLGDIVGFHGPGRLVVLRDAGPERSPDHEHDAIPHLLDEMRVPTATPPVELRQAEQVPEPGSVFAVAIVALAIFRRPARWTR